MAGNKKVEYAPEANDLIPASVPITSFSQSSSSYLIINFNLHYLIHMILFSGAGCASLSLLMRMIRSGKFTDKKILLIDKEQKNKNDRTWCFWETQNGFFEDDSL